MKQIFFSIVGASLMVLPGAPSEAGKAGSGFFINSKGHMLTYNHLVISIIRDRDGTRYVRQCRTLWVKGKGVNGPAHVVERDAYNNLAVIKVDRRAFEKEFAASRQNDGSTALIPSLKNQTGWRNIATTLAEPGGGGSSGDRHRVSGPAQRHGRVSFIRFATRQAQPGAKINLLGFPLGLKVSSQLKISSGTVAATVGTRNNTSVIQYDAASNKGSSGGPALDKAGNLIGVHYSGIGVIPGGLRRMTVAQGFNFAVKSSIAENFLRIHDIPYERATSDREITSEEVYQRSRNAVALVTCR